MNLWEDVNNAFLLSRMSQASEGKTLSANIALRENQCLVGRSDRGRALAFRALF